MSSPSVRSNMLHRAVGERPSVEALSALLRCDQKPAVLDPRIGGVNEASSPHTQAMTRTITRASGGVIGPRVADIWLD